MFSDYQKLFEFSDVLAEIQSVNTDPECSSLLYFDLSSGINPILRKLPSFLQKKFIVQ